MKELARELFRNSREDIHFKGVNQEKSFSGYMPSSTR